MNSASASKKRGSKHTKGAELEQRSVDPLDEMSAIGDSLMAASGVSELL